MKRAHHNASTRYRGARHTGRTTVLALLGPCATVAAPGCACPRSGDDGGPAGDSGPGATDATPPPPADASPGDVNLADHCAFWEAVELPTANAPTYVVVHDLAGDGNPDLAVAYVATDHVTIFLGDGTGAFDLRTDCGRSGAATLALDVGDLDADGQNDVVLANYGGNTVSILLRRR